MEYYLITCGWYVEKMYRGRVWWQHPSLKANGLHYETEAAYAIQRDVDGMPLAKIKDEIAAEQALSREMMN